MIIRNGRVFQEDKTFIKKDLYLENGRIVESPDGLTDRSEIDAPWDMISPTAIWRD